MNNIPMALVIFRFVLGPAFIAGYFIGVSPFWYTLILTLAFFSDVFDGVIARKLKVSTNELRSLDSWADTTFYVSVFLVAIIEYSYEIADFMLPIMILVVLEVVRHAYEKYKYGKSASYHMWSAKLWGIFLYLGFLQLFGFGEAGYFFVLAITVGIITDVEGLIASVILKSWKTDVPSVFHAYSIRNES